MTKDIPKLDNQKQIVALDTQNMRGSIAALDTQCQQAWKESRAVRVPVSYRKVDNIVIAGMGGSALGGDMITALFYQRLSIPITVVNRYDVPGFVGQNTLCIISSYSGSTEETVSAFHHARRKGARIMVIAAGGTLAKLARRYRIPAYIFDPCHNPSQQPRMGLGYSVMGQLGLLCQAGVLRMTNNTVNKTINAISIAHKRYAPNIKTAENKAKQAADILHGKIPVIIAAEHLSGNAHVMANQINENSKTFAIYFLISELNHHLMEGLRFPQQNKQLLTFVFLESTKYQAANIKRIAITRQVLKKAGIQSLSHATPGSTALEQAFSVLVYGSYVNYYLALLHNIDPSPIPYVDYFKKALAA